MGMSKWISQSLWIADLMVLAMLAFFIVLGGVDLGQSAGLTVAVGVLAVVGALVTWQRHRVAAVSSVPREAQRWRERRGF
jgi:hypothetical protein